MELADQRRQHVAGAQVEVVARAVEVGRHEREAVRAVLAVEAAAELDAGDLGDRVGAVGLLQRAGEQVLLAQRLRGLARVDAGAAEEDDLARPGGLRLADDVGLDLEVLVDELPGLLPVCEDAADLGGRDDDDLGALLGEEAARGVLVGEVELVEVAHDEVLVAGLVQGAQDRAADEAGVPGQVDARELADERRHAPDCIKSVRPARRSRLRHAPPDALQSSPSTSSGWRRSQSSIASRTRRMSATR